MFVEILRFFITDESSTFKSYPLEGMSFLFFGTTVQLFTFEVRRESPVRSTLTVCEPSSLELC